MTGVEIWAKIWHILLPCKKGGNMGRTSVDILGAVPGAPLLVQQRRPPDWPILIYKYGQKTPAAKYIGLAGQPMLDREA